MKKLFDSILISLKFVVVLVILAFPIVSPIIYKTDFSLYVSLSAIGLYVFIGLVIYVYDNYDKITQDGQK